MTRTKRGHDEEVPPRLEADESIPWEPECSGEGKCHGCLCWCTKCGDVANVCNADVTAEVKQCDRHQCDRCFKLLTWQDREDPRNGQLRLHCTPCHWQMDAEQAEDDMERYVALADYFRELSPFHKEHAAMYDDLAEKAAERMRKLCAM